MMVGFRLLAPIWFAICVLALASCAPPQPIRAPSQTQYPPVAPGMARVWFFRQLDPTAGNVYAGSPIVYANGAPIGDVPQGSVFFRDFAPGKYRFTVQPYGTPTPNTIPCSSDQGSKLTCRSSGKPTGKRATRGVAALPSRRRRQMWRSNTFRH